jgi:hypothetical protein
MSGKIKEMKGKEKARYLFLLFLDEKKQKSHT